MELTDTIGPASLHTSGGDIVAKNVNGNVEAHTSGGEISADTIRGDVDASTSGGEIRLLHVDGKIRGQTSGGSVHCSLVGTNRGISASTSGGSIELTLPRATTGDIEATTSGGEFEFRASSRDDGISGTVTSRDPSMAAVSRSLHARLEAGSRCERRIELETVESEARRYVVRRPHSSFSNERRDEGLPARRSHEPVPLHIVNLVLTLSR